MVIGHSDMGRSRGRAEALSERRRSPSKRVWKCHRGTPTFGISKITSGRTRPCRCDTTGPTELEPVNASHCKDDQLQNREKRGAAESGAVDAGNGPNDPDLARLIDVWPNLSEATRTKIVAIVDDDSH